MLILSLKNGSQTIDTDNIVMKDQFHEGFGGIYVYNKRLSILII